MYAVWSSIFTPRCCDSHRRGRSWRRHTRMPDSTTLLVTSYESPVTPTTSTDARTEPSTGPCSRWRSGEVSPRTNTWVLSATSTIAPGLPWIESRRKRRTLTQSKILSATSILVVYSRPFSIGLTVISDGYR